MNKQEILKKLKELSLDKDKYIIISGAALVLTGYSSQTKDIDLATTEKYYNSINWRTKIGANGTEIKYYDCFEIGLNYYTDEEIIIIEGFKVGTPLHSYKIKKSLKRDKDKNIIEFLEKELNL